MCTFVASEKVVGAALALSPSGRVTGTQLGKLKTYIYQNAPHYTILFSSESINNALSTYRRVLGWMMTKRLFWLMEKTANVVLLVVHFRNTPTNLAASFSVCRRPNPLKYQWYSCGLSPRQPEKSTTIFVRLFRK